MINEALAETLRCGIALAHEHGLLSASLHGLTIEDARLPRDRYGEFLPSKRLIRIDGSRAARSPGGVLAVAVHELAHAATPHLDSPGTWHNAEFQATRRAIALGVQMAGLRRRGEHPAMKAARKEPTMHEYQVPRTAAPREIRRRGTLAPEQQLALIRAWCREHPEMASIRGITFGFRNGRVRPIFDDESPSTIESLERRLRRMRARASTW